MDKTIQHWEQRGKQSFTYKGEDFYTITPAPFYYYRRNKILCFIKKQLDSLEKSCVLDFGCGDGYYSIFFSKQTEHLRFYGCDTSKAFINRAKINNKINSADVEFREIKNGIPFNKKFSLIFIISVFAHIYEDTEILRIIGEFNYKLFKNGLLVLVESTAKKSRGNKINKRRKISDYINYFNLDYDVIDITHNPKLFQTFINRTLLFFLRLLFFNNNGVLANKNRFYILISEVVYWFSTKIDALFKNSDGYTFFAFKKK